MVLARMFPLAGWWLLPIYLSGETSQSIVPRSVFKRSWSLPLFQHHQKFDITKNALIRPYLTFNSYYVVVIVNGRLWTCDYYEKTRVRTFLATLIIGRSKVQRQRYTKRKFSQRHISSEPQPPLRSSESKPYSLSIALKKGQREVWQNCLVGSEHLQVTTLQIILK